MPRYALTEHKDRWNSISKRVFKADPTLADQAFTQLRIKDRDKYVESLREALIVDGYEISETTFYATALDRLRYLVKTTRKLQRHNEPRPESKEQEGGPETSTKYWDPIRHT